MACQSHHRLSSWPFVPLSVPKPKCNPWSSSTTKQLRMWPQSFPNRRPFELISSLFSQNKQQQENGTLKLENDLVNL